MELLLKNLSWQNDLGKQEGDIRIQKNRIAQIGINLLPQKKEKILDFRNHFVYPGLINSHDHLEMNLYPKLGTPFYKNYIEWANDIYKPRQSPILEIEKVDVKDRLMWGGIKNLISGVTTVVHHNPWHRALGKTEFPVSVLKTAWAHSLALGKELHKSFPRKPEIPFVIHAAEGIDDTAFSEIGKLNALDLLKKNTVLIHAIALQQTDIDLLAREESSIVWCPSSNLFMFDQTAPIQKLKGRIKIGLGTDSTLTGSVNLLDEMRVAYNTGLMDGKEIYNLTTNSANRIFNLPDSAIASKNEANLFIAPSGHQDYLENLLSLKPSDISIVLNKGEVKLIDEKFKSEWSHLKYKIKLQGKSKFTGTNVSSLKRSIEKKVGSIILEKNPLWNLVEV